MDEKQGGGLDRLLSDLGAYGRPFWRRKGSGGARRIDPPHDGLKGFQRLVGAHVQSKIESPIAFGGVPGRSHVDAAQQHAKALFVSQIDIKDFFEHVEARHLRPPLESLGLEPAEIDFLLAVVCYRGSLPQGSPASPAMANLALLGSDLEIDELATGLGVTVTRVVDDYTISGPRWPHVLTVRSAVIQRLHALGFKISRKGSRQPVTPRHRQLLVHGLVVNEQASLPRNAPAGRRRLLESELRGAVRRAGRYGCTSAERRRLGGLIAYAMGIPGSKDMAGKLLAELRAARRLG